MIVLLRLEINVIALAILILLIVNIKNRMIMMLDEKLFRMILYTSVISVIVYSVAWALDGRQGEATRWILYGANGLYLISCVAVPYLWWIYVNFRLTEDENQVTRNAKVLGIPVLVFIIFTITAPINEWLFFIDKSNVYHRGPLYLVQVILSFVYLLTPSVRALQKAKKTTIPSEKKEYNSLAQFVILPLIGAIFQVLIYGLVLVSSCIVVAELMVYLNVQNHQITLDALTNINNRGQLNRYLNVVTKETRGEQKLYMLLLDINKFKRINDTYGHKKGDQALRDMAGVLKKVCDTYRCFLARYGGDEFAIVLECGDQEEVQSMIESIHRELEVLNRENKETYHLSASIGYAEFGTEHVATVEALIEAADREMYKQKAHVS